MKKARGKSKAVSAESIARLAEQGKDVSRFFTNRGLKMKPVERTYFHPFEDIDDMTRITLGHKQPKRTPKKS